jgi:CheY-like chemotaxis protein/anti-sigma regulatory factor (Ser/Thr protein kinase)
MTVRVLLVDDVEDVRRLVRIALRYHGGFDVVGEADAGLTAVDMATDLQPDVVLLDLGLPDLAGREVLTRLRDVAPQAKVVVFTGADEDRTFFEQNAAGYVLKSAELDYLVDLLDDVARAVDQEREAEFEADVRSVPLARDFVRQALEDWDAQHLNDEASLVVTELATNAVLHAGSPYRVRLRRTEGVVRIEVADGGSGTPEPQPFSATAETGRGIVLVSAISASWGIDARPGQGKVTWAELNGSRAPRAGS